MQSPKPAIPELISYILDTEGEDFREYLRQGSPLPSVAGLSPEDQGRVDALFQQLDDNGLQDLSVSDFDWLARRVDGHIYCDAMRASPEHSEALVALVERNIDGPIEEHLGWNQDSLNTLMRQFIEQSGLTKHFDAFAAEHALSELDQTEEFQPFAPRRNRSPAPLPGRPARPGHHTHNYH